jgi:hypothetical protein
MTPAAALAHFYQPLTGLLKRVEASSADPWRPKDPTVPSRLLLQALVLASMTSLLCDLSSSCFPQLNFPALLFYGE